MPASPAKPDPSRSRVPGSGVGAATTSQLYPEEPPVPEFFDESVLVKLKSAFVGSYPARVSMPVPSKYRRFDLSMSEFGSMLVIVNVAVLPPMVKMSWSGDANR